MTRWLARLFPRSWWSRYGPDFAMDFRTDRRRACKVVDLVRTLAGL